MANNKEFEARIKSEQTTVRISNQQLVCADCALRLDDTVILGNTSKCEVYPNKPNNVLLGGGCPYYLEE